MNVPVDPNGSSLQNSTDAFHADTLQGSGMDAGMLPGTWDDARSFEYIASHPDLMNAYGMNADAGRGHYASSGQTEGRQITFSAANYLAANEDLKTAFGTNEVAATQHYIETGRFEGRSLAPGQSQTAPQTRPIFRDEDGDGIGQIHLGGEWIDAQVETVDAYLTSGIGLIDLGAGRRVTAARDGGAPLAYSAVGNSLLNSELTTNQYLASDNGRYRALLQSDGNFVVYDTSLSDGWDPEAAIWASDTVTGQPGGTVRMQPDGNLVVQNGEGAPVWDSATYSQTATVDRSFRLLMQDDGNLVVYDDATSQALWSSQHGKLAEAGDLSGGWSDVRAL
ncbi:hypothetical protein AAD018_017360, partial [Aestuariibius insulae]